MGLYNFRPRYAPFILDGTKQHTIRAPRRYRDAPGATMHLYTGLRTPARKLLLRAPCVLVQPIAILTGVILVGPDALTPGMCGTLAWADGFRPPGSSPGAPEGAFDLMLRWWQETHGLPFEGHIYHWDFDARER